MGQATVTDFMSVRGEPFPAGHRIRYRRVIADEGAVDLTTEFDPRFDYARTVPAVKRTYHGASIDAPRMGDEQSRMERD